MIAKSKSLVPVPRARAETASFSFSDEVEVRVLMINGEAWFVATDVVAALGLDPSRGAGSYLNALREDERRVIWRRDYPNLFGGVRAPSYTVLSESGVYRLTMRSDKPEARSFQDWVTRDVLPAIRRDGAYFKGEESVKTGELGEAQFLLQAFEMLRSKVDRLSNENSRLTGENAAMAVELNRLTVNEFVALRHEYMGHNRKVQLGVRAAEICRVRGLPIERQKRVLRRQGVEREVSINVYDRQTLEEAYNVLFTL